MWKMLLVLLNECLPVADRVLNRQVQIVTSQPYLELNALILASVETAKYARRETVLHYRIQGTTSAYRTSVAFGQKIYCYKEVGFITLKPRKRRSQGSGHNVKSNSHS